MTINVDKLFKLNTHIHMTFERAKVIAAISWQLHVEMSQKRGVDAGIEEAWIDDEAQRLIRNSKLFVR